MDSSIFFFFNIYGKLLRQLGAGRYTRNFNQALNVWWKIYFGLTFADALLIGEESPFCEHEMHWMFVVVAKSFSMCLSFLIMTTSLPACCNLVLLISQRAALNSRNMSLADVDEWWLHYPRQEMSCHLHYKETLLPLPFTTCRIGCMDHCFLHDTNPHIRPAPATYNSKYTYNTNVSV